MLLKFIHSQSNVKVKKLNEDLNAKSDGREMSKVMELDISDLETDLLEESSAKVKMKTNKWTNVRVANG